MLCLDTKVSEDLIAYIFMATLHGVTTQKTSTRIFIAVNTSNLAGG
jgi:hypothetical protein